MIFYLIYRNRKDVPVVVNENILGYSIEGNANYLRVQIQGEGTILFNKSRIDYFCSYSSTGEVTVIFDRRKSSDILSQDFTGYAVTRIWSGDEENGHYIDKMERTSWAE